MKVPLDDDAKVIAYGLLERGDYTALHWLAYYLWLSGERPSSAALFDKRSHKLEDNLLRVA